jgi:hypothetical protein
LGNFDIFFCKFDKIVMDFYEKKNENKKNEEENNLENEEDEFINEEEIEILVETEKLKENQRIEIKNNFLC